MKILHVTSVSKPDGNGVATAVKKYFEFEKKYCEVALFNMEKDIIINENSFNLSNYSSISDLPNGFDKPTLVVFNEIYKTSYLKLYKECLKKNIPYVIIPHGCLVKQAQNHKKIKKIIGNLLFFNRFIDNSIVIQYLNENEMNNSVIKKHKYIISGNGIEVPNKTNKFQNKDFIFIGRYDVKVKGLDLLIETVKKNKEWFNDNCINVQLYGRNSGNGYEELKELILKNNVEDIININGSIYGEEKEKLLLNSYAFIQVSRHEGQPMAIMEAFAHGVPCILTYGTSFGQFANDNKCGIGIDFNSDELFAAMKKMNDVNCRNEYSKNARESIKQYEWEKVSKRCIEGYKDLL